MAVQQQRCSDSARLRVLRGSDVKLPQPEQFVPLAEIERYVRNDASGRCSKLHHVPLSTWHRERDEPPLSFLVKCLLLELRNNHCDGSQQVRDRASGQGKHQGFVNAVRARMTIHRVENPSESLANSFPKCGFHGIRIGTARAPLPRPVGHRLQGGIGSIAQFRWVGCEVPAGRSRFRTGVDCPDAYSVDYFVAEAVGKRPRQRCRSRTGSAPAPALPEPNSIALTASAAWQAARYSLDRAHPGVHPRCAMT
jgi:hypothetical protein